MAGSPPNLHTMDSRSACIQGVLKVKVKVKGHVIRALSWILGMSHSVIGALVLFIYLLYDSGYKFSVVLWIRGIRAQSTLGAGHFCPNNICIKINKTP